MSPPTAQAPFDEYRLLIMNTLERLEAAVNDLRNAAQEMRTDITILKVKAGLWGAGAGLVSGAVIGALVSRLMK
jgi:hypothetical protein